MARPVTLFTGQWADLKLETMCEKAKSFGYDGIELACWGDHVDVEKAAKDTKYAKSRAEIPAEYGLKVFAISNHLAGQAVCDLIDERHKSILNERIWGDGDPEGVRKRAAEEMKLTAQAAKNIGVKVVNGFTGSSIWHLLYSFPPVSPAQIEGGYADFARRWKPILDVFEKNGINFALEVHPTEIAFDVASAERAIEAVGGHKRFGFNFDPSHLVYQNVDYVKFIRKFGERIYHVHMKDAYMSKTPTEAGVFGGHVNFGDPRRTWDFRSLGRGSVDFEEIIRALNDIGYAGPLSVEWEDGKMDREHGAKEACAFVKSIDFKPSAIAFDAQFDKKKQAKK
ncbi:MAG: sugar phosphate isomerase/epimerase [Planctomycetota bacterium]|nr:sugar phosphate isomerase/epimerase [Planctomycetota bacterium]